MRQPRALFLAWATCIACTTPQPPVSVYGCPTSHADTFEACHALLRDAFPDDYHREDWAIVECGDLGVLATDERHGETFAVLPSGDVYHVGEACGWSLRP